MKFTFVKGAMDSVVWNPETDRPLAIFEKGLFTTKSDEVARRLREFGYREIGSFKSGPPGEGFDKQVDPLVASINAGDPSVNIRPAASETQALLKGRAESVEEGSSTGDDEVLYSPKKKKGKGKG
jgi:hypothetical protein